jgi:thiamine-phosphate pyrophosphorylase
VPDSLIETPLPSVGRLHVLTDFHFQQRFSHAELAARAAAGGADVIQFRQKHGSTRDLLATLRPTVAACRAAGVTCLVDDRLDLMLATDADGVHLGALDLPIADARAALDRMGGRPRVVGATVTTAEEARAAEGAGADYLGFGPVFATGSKDSPAKVKGLRGLEEAARAVDIPVIAIAGITVERVPMCLNAGAWGVAVMTAISTARDPEAATLAFRQAIDETVSA